jgi:phenylalanyl-tRNA synthetase beta subunit
MSMSTSDIRKFYRQETGRDPRRAPGRIERIASLLDEWGLTLEDVTIEHHSDPRWNQRSNRTDLERLARMIGYTNNRAGYCVARYWLIPLVTPTTKSL